MQSTFKNLLYVLRHYKLATVTNLLGLSFASPAYSSGNRAGSLPCLQQGSAVRIPLGPKAGV